jgi:hypothetical protein
MRYLLSVVTLAVLAFAATPVRAAVDPDGLPADAAWYFHADLDEMRKSPAGASLYDWLEHEVFSDIREESGIDLGKEVDRLTAYSAGEQGAVMVIDGNFSQETRDKALAAAAAAERFETLKSGGRTYYFVRGDGRHDGHNVSIDGVDNEFYFSFDLPKKLVVAAHKDQMQELLDNGGKIAGSRSHNGALFVLTAERSLIQAGMDTQGMDDEDDGFKSNILRNTEQVALMVADVAGKVAVDVQLIAKEKEMAESLASIVRGVLALQAFSEDMDPKVSQLLQGTRVDVDGTRLKISVAMTPEFIAAALDEA